MSGINELICDACGKPDHYCHEDDLGYALRCLCGNYPTGNFWISSNRPYDEADALLSQRKKPEQGRKL